MRITFAYGEYSGKLSQINIPNEDIVAILKELKDEPKSLSPGQPDLLPGRPAHTGHCRRTNACFITVKNFCAYSRPLMCGHCLLPL